MGVAAGGLIVKVVWYMSLNVRNIIRWHLLSLV